MNYYLLTDVSEETVDAIFISKTTTVEEIETSIQRIRETKDDDYQLEDLLEGLPDDVEVISDISKIYY